MADGVIYLTADFTAAVGTQTTATIARGLSATGPWVVLDTVALLGEVGQYYDTSVPLDTVVWYRWTGSPGGTTIVQGPYIEPSDGTVLLKDPLRPWADVTLDFCDSPSTAAALLCSPTGPELVWVGFGNEVRRSDANLFDIYQSETPADLWGRRKRLDGSLQILAKTLAASDALHALFTAGGPIQVQMPAVYGFPDAYIQPGDVTRAYLNGQRDQRMPFRLWSAPFTVVDRPVGPKQGTDTANWCALQDEFATYADLAASGLTWAQVASGAAVSPDDGYGLGPYGSGPYGDGG
jgi:hypothetical protein